MGNINGAEVVRVAREERQEEAFRAAVEKEKARQREAQASIRWWHKVFPWEISIRRRT